LCDFGAPRTAKLHAYQLDIIGIGLYHIPAYSLTPQFPFPSSKPSYSTHIASITICYIISPTTPVFNFATIYIKDKYNILFAPNRIRHKSVTLNDIQHENYPLFGKVQIDTLPVT
jgi:hypothetical protein